MTKAELLAAFPQGVGRVQVVPIGWHRKKGPWHATGDAEPEWGRFEDDPSYEGWAGFYDPAPIGRNGSRHLARVLRGGDRWKHLRTPHTAAR